MTVDEFTDRTDYEPTAAQWREIVRDYLSHDWEDKDMFCRRWLIERGQYQKIGEIIRRRKAQWEGFHVTKNSGR